MNGRGGHVTRKPCVLPIPLIVSPLTPLSLSLSRPISHLCSLRIGAYSINGSVDTGANRVIVADTSSPYLTFTWTPAPRAGRDPAENAARLARLSAKGVVPAAGPGARGGGAGAGASSSSSSSSSSAAAAVEPFKLHTRINRDWDPVAPLTRDAVDTCPGTLTVSWAVRLRTITEAEYSFFEGTAERPLALLGKAGVTLKGDAATAAAAAAAAGAKTKPAPGQLKGRDAGAGAGTGAGAGAQVGAGARAGVGAGASAIPRRPDALNIEVGAIAAAAAAAAKKPAGAAAAAAAAASSSSLSSSSAARAAAQPALVGSKRAGIARSLEFSFEEAAAAGEDGEALDDDDDVEEEEEDEEGVPTTTPPPQIKRPRVEEAQPAGKGGKAAAAATGGKVAAGAAALGVVDSKRGAAVPPSGVGVTGEQLRKGKAAAAAAAGAAATTRVSASASASASASSSSAAKGASGGAVSAAATKRAASPAIAIVDPGLAVHTAMRASLSLSQGSSVLSKLLGSNNNAGLGSPSLGAGSRTAAGNKKRA